jgi:adenylate cyclase class 2
MANEIEIKFLVEDVRGLERRLRSAGFRMLTPKTHEMNTLYDQPGSPLRARGELLRLRKYGTRWVLTHKAKGKYGRHKSRVETETEVSDGKQMDQILAALGFSPSFRYEKFRSEWSDGKGHVVVDRTPIGDIAEIEGPARWIDATAKKLGVSRDQYITENYAQMFEEWKQQTGSKAQEMTFKAVGKRKLSEVSS